jgi:hypothetical protein
VFAVHGVVRGTLELWRQVLPVRDLAEINRLDRTREFTNRREASPDADTRS